MLYPLLLSDNDVALPMYIFTGPMQRYRSKEMHYPYNRKMTAWCNKVCVVKTAFNMIAEKFQRTGTVSEKK